MNMSSLYSNRPFSSKGSMTDKIVKIMEKVRVGQYRTIARLRPQTFIIPCYK